MFENLCFLVLSQRNEASVEVDSMYEGRDFFLQLTRARWEILNESHLRYVKFIHSKIHKFILSLSLSLSLHSLHLLWHSLYRKINEHLQQILSDTKLLEDTSFSAIICAGSGCKISKVKTILETISQTSNRKIPILDSIDPETVVVRGKS
jgi:molecular chaperone DnaK (HSP70)